MSDHGVEERRTTDTSYAITEHLHLEVTRAKEVEELYEV